MQSRICLNPNTENTPFTFKQSLDERCRIIVNNLFSSGLFNLNMPGIKCLRLLNQYGNSLFVRVNIQIINSSFHVGFAEEKSDSGMYIIQNNTPRSLYIGEFNSESNHCIEIMPQSSSIWGWTIFDTKTHTVTIFEEKQDIDLAFEKHSVIKWKSKYDNLTYEAHVESIGIRLLLIIDLAHDV